MLLFLAVVNAFAFLLSADVSLIQFHDAGQFALREFHHRFANAMHHVPRGPIASDAEMLLQLIRGHSFFRVHHDCECHEPFRQRQMRTVKDRADRVSKTLSTFEARIQARA